MAKIQELTEMLANQIAAGEVVERPASVVKELVENSIDAGSTQIDIFVEEAGLKRIEVIDNGEGIEEDDVLNAFKRHATSKIHIRDDLFRIRTLGFRGEALPSIASVSEITIETSTGEDVGTFVSLKGGDIQAHTPHSMRRGTKIVVSNLFFNTPARLKYVRSLQTELAKIGDIVGRLALSHPDISFRLVHDGNKMLTTLGNGDLKQAIAGIYGISTAKKMIAIQQKDLDFTVNGFVSLPEVTRARNHYLSIIINGRYIRNYALNKAVVDGYGSKLMVGRFPIGVIQIEMDPLLTDVNVHPTKQEVRLSKEPELMQLITQAIRESLMKERLIPKVSESNDFRKKRIATSKSEQIEMRIPISESKEKQTLDLFQHRSQNASEQGLAYDPKEGRFFIPSKQDEILSKDFEKVQESADFIVSEMSTKNLQTEDGVDNLTKKKNSSSMEMKTDESISEVSKETIISDDGMITSELIEENDISIEESRMQQVNTMQRHPEFPDLEYIGQMHGTYLLAQSVDGLYIIDQHAAQERIKYEYFRSKIGEVSNDLQELLVALVLDYSPSDKLQIQEKKNLLEEVGIYLETFGQNSFIIRAHPTWYPKGQEEQIIREMIDTLLMTGKVDIAKFREDTAIMMSCKQSIKANHHLDATQARQLLYDLAYCENPYNCPHGRPVLIHFTNKDMEKMFKRIQDPH